MKKDGIYDKIVNSYLHWIAILKIAILKNIKTTTFNIWEV